MRSRPRTKGRSEARSSGKHLWFFGAGRYANVLGVSHIAANRRPYQQADKNQRAEIKVTGTVAETHTIQAGYLRNTRTTSNDSGILDLIIDPASLVPRDRPNSYLFTTWRGTPTGANARWRHSTRNDSSSFVGGGTSERHRRFAVRVLRRRSAFTRRPISIPAIRKSATTGNSRGTSPASGTGSDGTRRRPGTSFIAVSASEEDRSRLPTMCSGQTTRRRADGRPLRDSAGRLIPMFVPGESGARLLSGRRAERR